MAQKIIWQYSDEVLTGWVITGIALAASITAAIIGNLPAGIFAFLVLPLGIHRISYAHGMRDMHALDNDIEGTLKDFNITAETEDEK